MRNIRGVIRKRGIIYLLLLSIILLIPTTFALMEAADISGAIAKKSMVDVTGNFFENANRENISNENILIWVLGTMLLASILFLLYVLLKSNNARRTYLPTLSKEAVPGGEEQKLANEVNEMRTDIADHVASLPENEELEPPEPVEEENTSEDVEPISSNVSPVYVPDSVPAPVPSPAPQIAPVENTTNPKFEVESPSDEVFKPEMEPDPVTQKTIDEIEQEPMIAPSLSVQSFSQEEHTIDEPAMGKDEFNEILEISEESEQKLQEAQLGVTLKELDELDKLVKDITKEYKKKFPKHPK